MKREILEEDLSVKQILLQCALGAAFYIVFFLAICAWDWLMHWISGC